MLGSVQLKKAAGGGTDGSRSGGAAGAAAAGGAPPGLDGVLNVRLKPVRKANKSMYNPQAKYRNGEGGGESAVEGSGQSNAGMHVDARATVVPNTHSLAEQERWREQKAQQAHDEVVSAPGYHDQFSKKKRAAAAGIAAVLSQSQAEDTSRFDGMLPWQIEIAKRKEAKRLKQKDPALAAALESRELAKQQQEQQGM